MYIIYLQIIHIVYTYIILEADYYNNFKYSSLFYKLFYKYRHETWYNIIYHVRIQYKNKIITIIFT